MFGEGQSSRPLRILSCLERELLHVLERRGLLQAGRRDKRASAWHWPDISVGFPGCEASLFRLFSELGRHDCPILQMRKLRLNTVNQD